MCLINKVYTAQDMRDAAKCLFACEVDLKHDNRDISKMLRQAADMMDRADGEAAYKREREAGADKEAEIARLKAALSVSNDELDLARSNSVKMYHRLNSKNIRNSEMYRETIRGLRAENARLRAALKPILECKVMSAMTAEIGPGRSDYCAAIIEKAQRIYFAEKSA